ncbi:MAG: hypothetical protein U0790_14400 [Isosphaeraceae bacterium]
MLSPNDSWQTPTWSDRNRLSLPIRAAITWSMDGPPAPRPENISPETSPLIELWCPFPGPGSRAAGLSMPLRMWMSERYRANGWRQGVSS